MRNLEGVVVVDILVDTTGKMAEMKLFPVRPMLQQAALDALRRWRYRARPAQRPSHPDSHQSRR